MSQLLYQISRFFFHAAEVSYEIGQVVRCATSIPRGIVRNTTRELSGAHAAFEPGGDKRPLAMCRYHPEPGETPADYIRKYE